jgi:hypothetical protein
MPDSPAPAGTAIAGSMVRSAFQVLREIVVTRRVSIKFKVSDELWKWATIVKTERGIYFIVEVRGCRLYSEGVNPYHVTIF